ncbi:hypothetical protein L3Q82_026896 [Scortum barcoo]|uniref:Uncharacterized protein n=1 Tax=Scortum barcoo TaxID=214431 RepID=A0ACB8WK88_9TELE|nr:hypothetical protein L3Q82_026896 [Scortum barcoo]
MLSNWCRRSVSCPVEEVSLAVGEVVGYGSVKSASRMNGAVVIFLDSLEKVSDVVVSGTAYCSDEPKEWESSWNQCLPVDFFNSFWSVLGEDLVEVVNNCLERGRLPLSCRRAVITLLPNKGDLQELKNWRPVFLLCTDYKILSKSKVLASRLREVMASIIHPDQTDMCPAGYSVTTSLLIQDILEVSGSLAVDTGLISIDQEKAFDQGSVSGFFGTALVPQSIWFLPEEKGGQGLVHLASRSAAFRLQFIQTETPDRTCRPGIGGVYPAASLHLRCGGLRLGLALFLIGLQESGHFISASVLQKCFLSVEVLLRKQRREQADSLLQQWFSGTFFLDSSPLLWQSVALTWLIVRNHDPYCPSRIDLPNHLAKNMDPADTVGTQEHGRGTFRMITGLVKVAWVVRGATDGAKHVASEAPTGSPPAIAPCPNLGQSVTSLSLSLCSLATSRSSQSPNFSRSSQSPNFSRSSQSPNFSRSSQSPNFSRSSHRHSSSRSRSLGLGLLANSHSLGRLAYSLRPSLHPSQSATSPYCLATSQPVSSLHSSLPPRPAGFQPAPRPSGFQPAPRPSGFQPAPRPSGFQPAPRPPGFQPAPQPAPRPSSFQPTPKLTSKPAPELAGLQPAPQSLSLQPAAQLPKSPPSWPSAPAFSFRASNLHPQSLLQPASQHPSFSIPASASSLQLPSLQLFRPSASEPSASSLQLSSPHPAAQLSLSQPSSASIPGPALRLSLRPASEPQPAAQPSSPVQSAVRPAAHPGLQPVAQLLGLRPPRLRSL